MLTALSILSVALLLITAYSLHLYLVKRVELRALIRYLQKKEITIEPATLLECVREITGG